MIDKPTYAELEETIKQLTAKEEAFGRSEEKYQRDKELEKTAIVNERRKQFHEN